MKLRSRISVEKCPSCGSAVWETYNQYTMTYPFDVEFICGCGFKVRDKSDGVLSFDKPVTFITQVFHGGLTTYQPGTTPHPQPSCGSAQTEHPDREP